MGLTKNGLSYFGKYIQLNILPTNISYHVFIRFDIYIYDGLCIH